MRFSSVTIVSRDGERRRRHNGWLEMATRAETFAPHGLAFLLLTILLSWAFIHTMFALHYAHEFYPLHGKKGGGLDLPA